MRETGLDDARDFTLSGTGWWGFLWFPSIRYNQAMKTDSLFYRLFQNDPGLALDLAGLAVSEPGRYRFGSQEVK